MNCAWLSVASHLAILSVIACFTSIGRLCVGDQILVCDGISLIEVTHDEAAQALKRAMDMESVSEAQASLYRSWLLFYA